MRTNCSTQSRIPQPYWTHSVVTIISASNSIVVLARWWCIHRARRSIHSLLAPFQRSPFAICFRRKCIWKNSDRHLRIQSRIKLLYRYSIESLKWWLLQLPFHFLNAKLRSRIAFATWTRAQRAQCIAFYAVDFSRVTLQKIICVFGWPEHQDDLQPREIQYEILWLKMIKWNKTQ